MTKPREIVIGLDVGTGGARAAAVDFDGRRVATGRAEFPPEASRAEGVIAEQNPRAWTAAAEAALRAAAASLSPSDAVVGIAVDATSGTFLLADERNEPLTPGIMYNDLRATEFAGRAAEALRATLQPYGIEIAAAFALPKILHVAATQPEVFARCRRILHQTDWIVGRLCGRYDVTDISTALKTGADPGRLEWPEAIESKLGLARRLLPRLVLPGELIGNVTAEAAAATGLPAGAPVVAGCTDGTAGLLASGAGRSGDLNITLGTTLVFKAVSERPVVDPDGSIYNHRHPAGGFLPGAASSTGAAWIPRHFTGVDLDALGREAAALLPTSRIAYPLMQRGERFPFACPLAEGFGLDGIASPAERFAAGMEGVAFLERMGVERFESLGLPIGDTIYATGGGTSGETWLRIRAAANRRVYAVPEQPECAIGAAVLAAAARLGRCTEAIRRLVRIGRRVEPDARLAEAYEEAFQRFQAALRERGYR